MRRSLASKNREQSHAELVNRVKRYRFYKMLEFLGADPDEYLRTIPIEDINQQIERCSSCPQPDYCDRCLGDGKQVDNMDFCPNHPSLSEHSKTIHLKRQLNAARNK